MRRYELRLLEDRFPGVAGAIVRLPPQHRVLYLVEGEVTVATQAGSTRLAANSVWQGSSACSLEARSDSACIWRWELVPAQGRAARPGSGDPAFSTLKLAHAIELDPEGKYLIRCDRVDFPLSGVAYTHTHQGPGIRCLLLGELSVKVGGKRSLIRPGEAWFEPGPDPVYAEASSAELTSFVRVMILPAALKGKSSIRYVTPEDQAKPKTQTYTIFLDELIEI